MNDEKSHKLYFTIYISIYKENVSIIRFNNKQINVSYLHYTYIHHGVGITYKHKLILKLMYQP